MENKRHVLLINCSDEIGLIYNIANVLLMNKLNIVQNSEYVENINKQFFFRSEIEGELSEEVILTNLKSVLPGDAKVKLIKNGKKKIAVLGTKEHHCLGDLLLRNKYATMNAEICCVICNHSTLSDLVSKFDIPFHTFSAKGLEREEHEAKIIEQLEQYDFDIIVLAKYMRILTSNFVSKYSGRIINIHHSFLPAFIGANPYKQAFQRGVKIIGATAHFVTDDLDEGPIITQDVINIDHTFTAKSMAKAGRDVERTVLSDALDLVFEDRVMINGNKTIIF